MDTTQGLTLFYVITLMILSTAFGYSMGHRAGHGEGYLRGRAIAKAIKERELQA